MAEGVAGFFCRLIPHTQEYGMMSNILWDATLPVFIQGVLLHSRSGQLLYVFGALAFWALYYWAYQHTDIESVYFALLYWAVIYLVISALIGVISGHVVRAIPLRRNRIILIVVHLIIWTIGYYIAVQVVQATADTFQALTC